MLGSYQDHIRNMLGPGQDHVGTMLGAMDNIRTRRHKICAIAMFLCAITTLQPSEFFVSHIYTYIYIHVSRAEADGCWLQCAGNNLMMTLRCGLRRLSLNRVYFTQTLITLGFWIPMGAIPSPLELRCDPIFNGRLERHWGPTYDHFCVLWYRIMYVYDSPKTLNNWLT